MVAVGEWIPKGVRRGKQEDEVISYGETLIFEDGYFQAFYQGVLNSRKLLKLP